MERINRNIICIDLKSFYASCECIKRKLDPFTYPLVVANPYQKGAITLAVTPYLKKLGVASRTRLYDIPKNIKYYIAPPRMSFYVEMSKKVISIYLDYVSSTDLHAYSIDECFLDVTSYLKLYQKTDYELAKDILKNIYNKTGLTATAGIGPNMLLAKVSMDIEAKHNSDCIAKWTYEDVKTKLWNISPLSKMWGIGSGIEKRLNKMKIFSVKDLANSNPRILKEKFGIIGLELYNHANGIDNSIISEENYIIKEKSLSSSQILFEDYNEQDISLIIREMVENLTIRLRKNNKLCTRIGLGIGYSKTVGGGFYHIMKLDNAIDSNIEIIKICLYLFEKYYEEYPIRKVSISLSGLTSKLGFQLSIFNNYEASIKNSKLNTVIDSLQTKYGKNSVLKASSLLEKSTIKDRNLKIGGHHA